MSLSPVHTPAEILLLRGPQRLERYTGESFSWIQALRRGPTDWNTLLSLDTRTVARIQRIAMWFVMQLPASPNTDDTPDPHHSVRNIALFLNDIANLVTQSRQVARQAAKTELFASLARDLSGSNLPIEQRTLQEWHAWISALESFMLQEQRVTELVHARLKRQADDAELEAANRPAPVEVD